MQLCSFAEGISCGLNEEEKNNNINDTCLLNTLILWCKSCCVLYHSSSLPSWTCWQLSRTFHRPPRPWRNSYNEEGRFTQTSRWRYEHLSPAFTKRVFRPDMANMKQEDPEISVKTQARYCSVAWKYYIKNESNATVYCRLCKTNFKFSSNTANMIKHLRVKHRLNIPAVANGGERLCTEEPGEGSMGEFQKYQTRTKRAKSLSVRCVWGAYDWKREGNGAFSAHNSLLWRFIHSMRCYLASWPITLLCKICRLEKKTVVDLWQLNANNIYYK